MRIQAPFTDEQVAALNAFQRLGHGQPFTCTHHSQIPLVAAKEGWRCGDPNCAYTQAWAHSFMADARQHPQNPFTEKIR